MEIGNIVICSFYFIRLPLHFQSKWGDEEEIGIQSEQMERGALIEAS